ncbi:MAG: hypothetical protein WC683_17730 [bacterium]
MTTFMVKPIVPKSLSTIKDVRLAILNALRAEGREECKLLQQTTAHWTHDKPRFETLIGFAGGDASLLVGPGGSITGSQKWVWLDEGTRAHEIKPKRARYLVFRTGYSAGSTPGTFATKAASTSGEVARAKIVHHPGTKARGWSILLQKERWRPFRERINKVIEEIAK